MNNPVHIWRNTKELHKFLGKKGEIVVWTKIFVAPEGFESQVPYYAGIIELENGIRKTFQIVDCDKDPKFGQKVILVIRRIKTTDAQDVIQYGIKAKLLP